MRRSAFTAAGLGLLAVCSAASAVARSGFEWGHYDSALYAYSKHPEQLPRFEEALRNAIEKGRAHHRLAPGLQAELGYCLLREGKTAEASALFRAEMNSFPESRVFLAKFVDGEQPQ